MSRFARWVREHIGGANSASQPGSGARNASPARGATHGADQESGLDARARRLVEAAAGRAAESYPQIARIHPSLAAVARERWELCAMAAAACMGLQMMVRRPEILESFEPLQGLVHGALASRHPEAPSLFDQCRLFLARAASSHSTFTGQNVIGDRIGLWLLTTLFTRPPTVHEQGIGRAIGRAIDLPLQAWWD